MSEPRQFEICQLVVLNVQIRETSIAYHQPPESRTNSDIEAIEAIAATRRRHLAVLAERRAILAGCTVEEIAEAELRTLTALSQRAGRH